MDTDIIIKKIKENIMKTESKEKPVINKLQGKILIPYCIEQKTRINEDNQTETYYQYNLLKLPLDVDTSLQALKAKIKAELKKQNDEYIYNKYAPGTQQTMQALYADSNTSSEHKALIISVWDWIRKTDVLPYYYSKKTEIENATSVNTLLDIVWDFSQFDVTDPKVKLRDLV